MQMLDHPNIVALKHYFISTTDKEELYLNLVLEFVPETVNRIARHYNRMSQRMPLIYVKLYTYQVYCSLMSHYVVLLFYANQMHNQLTWYALYGISIEYKIYCMFTVG